MVRAVPTDVVAEQFRAGESTDTIADLSDLTARLLAEADLLKVARMKSTVGARGIYRHRTDVASSGWIGAQQSSKDCNPLVELGDTKLPAC